MHKHLGFLTIFAALAALALAPAANAATFDLGPGENPDLAVDEGGTGHFVWNNPVTGGDDVVTYCQVPRGSRACALTRTFTPTGEAIGRSTYVFLPGPNRVVIFASRCCTENFVIESNDGGQTFGAPRKVGTVESKANAALGAGDRILSGGGSTWQVQPLAGPPPASAAELNPGFSIPTSSSGAFFNGTIPVVMLADGDNASFLYWTGAGDVNNAASWSGPHPLDNPGSDVRLAGGPAGLVAIYRLRSDAGSTIVARKFDGANFSAPIKVSETADPIESDLYANPVTGEFTAVWVDNREPNEWMISRSKDGVTWSSPRAIVRGNAEADNRFGLQVAAAGDGKGFAASDGQTGGNITATPLDELPEAGADKPTATTTVNGTRISFFAPRECVQEPADIVLRVTSKRKRQLSPRRRVKITKVVFSVDRKKKTDKKKAFRKSFTTRGMKRGSRHKVRAVVRLAPVKKGAFKPKVKRLKGRFRICS